MNLDELVQRSGQNAEDSARGGRTLSCLQETLEALRRAREQEDLVLVWKRRGTGAQTVHTYLLGVPEDLEYDPAQDRHHCRLCFQSLVSWGTEADSENPSHSLTLPLSLLTARREGLPGYERQLDGYLLSLDPDLTADSFFSDQGQYQAARARVKAYL